MIALSNGFLNVLFLVSSPLYFALMLCTIELITLRSTDVAGSRIEGPNQVHALNNLTLLEGFQDFVKC